MDPKDEIKQRLDIFELIGEYLELRKSGSASYKALCPFHAEKTPSFHVSQDKQIWHCFGCHEGGDLFSFVMKMEGLTFPEALRLMGKKAGVEIPRFSSAESNERQRLVEVNELAARFYQKVLKESTQALLARQYITSRGIDDDLSQEFGLGYAPESWDSLVQFFTKKGVSLKEGESAGLVQRKKSGSGYIDRFRHRIMIPLCDTHGNVIGFTARLLSGNEGPKYMNSPETGVYRKGEMLYGLHLAKQAIKENDSVIIVEGNLDVIASHKAGVKNVVASSGTALTEKQLQLLKRFTQNLNFCFDQDDAGFEAARRGMAIARQMEFQVRVIMLNEKDGKDPDDIVQKSAELWQSLVKKPIHVMKYFIERITQGKNLSNIDEKIAVSRLLLPEVAVIPNVVEREHWLQVIADLLKTDRDQLRKAIQGKLAKMPVEKAEVKESIKVEDEGKQSRENKIAAYILAIALQDYDYFDTVIAQVNEQVMSGKPTAVLYSFLKNRYTPDIQSVQKSFFGQVCEQASKDQDAEELLVSLQKLGVQGEQHIADRKPDQVQKQLNDSIHTLKDLFLNQKRKELEREIRLAETRADSEAVQKLMQEYKDLQT